MANTWTPPCVPELLVCVSLFATMHNLINSDTSFSIVFRVFNSPYVEKRIRNSNPCSILYLHPNRLIGSFILGLGATTGSSSRALSTGTCARILSAHTPMPLTLSIGALARILSAPEPLYRLLYPRTRSNDRFTPLTLSTGTPCENFICT